ncbi:MAG: RnfABCDGE type electron transport complex subunit G [Planctomycetes bacterium]|nr:RnfABCDGE type electron transport complex subunit G [Planctomycetota bacterium]
MNETTKMILALTLICAACGFLLAAVRRATEGRIEDQIMKYVKGPAVRRVLRSATNDPVRDRNRVTIDGKPVTVFIGRTGGEITGMAYETTVEGFGGEMGVVVGYDLKRHGLTGIGITAHKETPGVGSRVTREEFSDRFAGKALDAEFALKRDGGEIDAVTGATTSSRAVCRAVQKSIAEYPKIKKQILNR